MERTEQEKKVESLLENLITVAGRYLKIVFITADAAQRNSVSDRSLETQVWKRKDYVELILKEPVTPADLTKWVEVIIKAEEMLDLIEKEKAWLLSNPNFFEAIQAKIEYASKKFY